MEVEKCRALLLAAECGTITQAAEKLCYTVSGISKMIASLEQETGFSLIVRNRAGVSMTQEGKEILPALRQVVASAGDLEQKIGEVKGIACGRVRIGTSYQSYFKKLAAIIADFKKQYPNIQIELVEGTSSRLYEMLRQQEIDLCIASKRENWSWFTEIGQDEILAWLPPTKENLARKEYPVRNLEKESYIAIYPGEETDNSLLLKRLGIHVTGNYATSQIYAALAMVEAGLGIALINRLWAKDIGGNAAAVPLKPRQFLKMGLAEGKESSLAARRFKEYLLREA